MSESSKGSFYITTTLPYVNADPHVGFAMEFIRADVIARYKKLQGFDVFFNTGTDEHGMKLFKAAEKEGKDVQTYVDGYAERFKGLIELLDITPDVHFIRTTDEKHIKAATEFWKRVSANGYIYKKNYKTKYCVGCESEKTESELVDGKCPIHNTIPEIIEEENYFFKYSAFQEKLLAFYEKNQSFVIPNFRLNEVREFVKHGLEDFSISRLKSKMPWGIEVPGDSEQVMYVWFDALVSYISTLGWPNNTTQFETFWQNGTPVQYCGKDNNRFQSAMWQAMLMAAELPQTSQVIVNGFVTGEGGIKMSKSLGNVVNPYDIVAEYGTDALRYFLLREMNSFEDSPFTMERFKAAYNSGLANGLGNLVSRLLKMSSTNGVALTAEETKKSFEGHKDVECFDIKTAMDDIWIGIQAIDKDIQAKEPFRKIKTDPESAKNDLHKMLLDLFDISLSLEPFMPHTARRIQECIKTNTSPEVPLFARKD